MGMSFRKHLNIGNEAWHSVKCQARPVITCLINNKILASLVSIKALGYSMRSLVSRPLVRPVSLCDEIFGKKIRLQYKRNFPSVY